MQLELTKEFLEDTYCAQGLSTWAIESRYGIPRSRVFNALKRFGIPSRTLAQSHITYTRADFSGDALEKVYLIGFAIGDLRVRNHGGARSETISIACGSTKTAQIELIQSMFAPYGRVWVGKPNSRGVVNVEAFVNTTFAFLIKKDCNYMWCAEAADSFFAFLAGFTDAEGSFYLTRNQARVAWGNYDTSVLMFIKNGLTTFGIRSPNIICDSLGGTVGSHGFRRNKNYCHLTCARKDVIRMLIARLKPYIRHADKKIALQAIERNLEARGMIL